MRRASISISSNIAEGSGRISRKDQAHFIQLSYGSLMELLSQTILVFEMGFIKLNIYVRLRKLIEELANKLNALRKTMLSNSANQHITNSTN